MNDMTSFTVEKQIQELVTTEDLLSKLQDAVIINEILFLLSKSKFAIRTGILSKRWQNLWSSVSKLVFDDLQYHKPPKMVDLPYSFNHLPFKKFYITVNKTISQYLLDRLEVFDVKANYSKAFVHYVNRWIEVCVSKKVKIFNLCLKQVNKYDLYEVEADSFYSNLYFTKINLKYCNLNPDVSITWNNITCLSIGNTEIQEGLLLNILAGSPLLSYLKFESCYGSLINIESASVKELVLIRFNAYEDDHVVSINAPKILALTIVSKMFTSNILLWNVSSLVKAKIDFLIPRNYITIRKEDQEEVLKDVIQKLHHVESVTIGYSCYKVISCLAAKGFTFPSNFVGVSVSMVYYLHTDSDVSSGKDDDEIQDNSYTNNSDYE